MKQAQSTTNRIYLYTLLLALGAAFWLRWRFAQTINPYADEFATLLAMDMIRQKGLPILPSGLFYDHGLLYSYIAALASMLGDPLLWGRIVSLACGLLTIILTYRLGKRWLSPAAGLPAAVGLALAPSAIEWGGRVRMYALLQLLVLLTITLMLHGIHRRSAKLSWLAVGTYFGAMLTQFSSIALLPPLALAEVIALNANRKTHPRWYADWRFWLRGMAVGAAAVVAFLVKRAGQPKGIAPIEAVNPVAGIWQVLQIYGELSLDAAGSWAALAPFFTQPPVLIFSLFALVGLASLVFPATREQRPAVRFLAIVLLVTTLEMLFLVSPDRRDDKYLFMLLPVLLLLGGWGMALTGRWLGSLIGNAAKRPVLGVSATVAAIILIAGLAWGQISALLDKVGEDYSTAFAVVGEEWQPGDALLTGTPTAAWHYLGRNDFYAVQALGKYDYRILPGISGPVERWLGSPVIDTLPALNEVLSRRPVWLVLERWGLLIEFYDPFFRQNILAQTEFVREDNGIIVLKSLPDAKLLRETPAVPVEAILHGTEGDSGQLKLLGHTLEGSRLTLYWQAAAPLAFEYTVFVNVQNEAGETVLQTDHRPLGQVMPTTLWPIGEIIRETSNLELPPGDYHLRAGMYRLETNERLWVPDDESLQNMVDLGEIQVTSDE